MNQFTEQFSIKEIAVAVQCATADQLGRTPEIRCIPNPRVEQEDHYYNAKHTALKELGLAPHLMHSETLRGMVERVNKFKKVINPEAFKPTVKWRQ